MKKTFQFLMWVGLTYVAYKKMYPNGLPSFNLEEGGNHETDKTSKNTPSNTTLKKLNKPSKKTKIKATKKQP